MRLVSSGVAAVTGSPAPLVAAADAKRASVLIIQVPTGANPVYVGHSGSGGDAVTTANGLEIAAGMSLTLEVDDPSTVWLVTASSSSVRYLQLNETHDRR